MENKKGLIGVAAALVAVLVVAVVAYNTLGVQQGVAELAPSGTSAVSADAEGASASLSASGDSSEASETGVSAQGASAPAQSPAVDDSASDAGSSGEENGSSEEEPVPLPDFTIVDQQNEAVKLSSFHGKPTLVGFWATWCPPCNAEAPLIQELYDTYGDRVNFVMIDSASDGRDTPSIARDWLEEGDYTYPVYFDMTGEAVTTCQIRYLPTMFALDKEGNVLTAFTGALDEKGGTQLVEDMLAR
ncbi:MAG: TlpA family protein disulfide reductase [Eggerthellaceae bacterium]|nr:TlpA family protein disulfide reductase [Eggerthellaceae bacterium]